MNAASRRLARWLAPLAAGLALGACRGPVGMLAEPLEPPRTRATPVPEDPDRAAHDLGAAALAGGPEATREALARIETLEAERRRAGEPPTGLVPYGQHVVDGTLDDPIAVRRASERLLSRDDLDPALRRKLEIEVADDPLALASARIGEARQVRVARGVNAFSEALGRSLFSTMMAPVRLVQAAIGVAVAEHMADPIAVQERQALAHWKRYVESHPGSPETPKLLARIDSLQRRWFSMKRERSVRASRLALEQDKDDVALVLAARALAYAPEDREATKLRDEAEGRVLARRAARAESVAPPADPPRDAGDPRADALARALLDSEGEVESAARAILDAQGPQGPLADEALFSLAIVAGERGDEASQWEALGRVSAGDPAQHGMARHARQLTESPDTNPYAAFQRARVDHVGDQMGFVALGSLAHGARDRDLPRALEWMLEAPGLVSTLGGIPARLVQTAFVAPASRAPAVYASQYLARQPDGRHAPELRGWLVEHWQGAGDPMRAHAIAAEGGFEPERVAELEDEASRKRLEIASKQPRRDVRLLMLSDVAERHPDTESGREATDLIHRELEDATAQSIRISRGFLLENPAFAGPAGLGLRPELLDDARGNGELHPAGVRLVGGRVLEFSLLAASGDPDDPPQKLHRQVSDDRLARLVALLEETALRNALLDPLAEQAPDAQRDLFFERAKLGVADSLDPRATASSSYAFVGVRERYGMVRSRDAILPIDIVVQGSFPDLGLGAFPRLRMPRTTPDAVLYK